MENIEQFSDNHLFEDLLLDESPLSINQHDSVSLRSIAISLKRIADALYEYKGGRNITNSLGGK
jgi:hypothetical protein